MDSVNCEKHCIDSKDVLVLFLVAAAHYLLVHHAADSARSNYLRSNLDRM